jgi:hypothetical protein
MMRASAVLFVPAFLVAVVARTRTLKAPAFVACGLSLPALIVIVNNWWRFGSIFDTGYPALRYDTPWWEGVFGLLASPGKGLFLYAPLALYAVSKAARAWTLDRELTFIVMWGLCANLWLFSRFEIWSGDNAYGPRYMGIVLPLLLVLICVVARELRPSCLVLPWLAGVLLTFGGVLTYVNAVYYKYSPALIEFTGKSAENADGTINWSEVRQTINFIPRYSQLYMHLESADNAISNFVSNLRPKNEIDVFKDGVAGQLSWYSAQTRLDTWWATWLYVRGPRWVLALLLVPFYAMYFGVRNLRAQLKLKI